MAEAGRAIAIAAPATSSFRCFSISVVPPFCGPALEAEPDNNHAPPHLCTA